MALDVAPPTDFTDPDTSFLDNLPQPYRLIVGVLDTEVGKREYNKYRHDLMCTMAIMCPHYVSRETVEE